MLTIDDFPEFFAALNKGNKPFTWQIEVLRMLVETGEWPRQIAAPTGSGKSSVVDIHIFANVLSAIGQAPRIPRRLHTVVNRRGLVDNQFEKAVDIQHQLMGSKDTGGLLAEAYKALRTLRVGTNDDVPFVSSVLRGGLSARSLPVDDPSACAVIASTPDMWGSRALFRGYGSTRGARPRETALMTIDSAIVVDEAHLNRQLLVTARRIRELQELERNTGLPLLQVVETTATPVDVSSMSTVSVDPDSLVSANDVPLKERLFSHKELEYLPLEKWKGTPALSDTVEACTEFVMRKTEDCTTEETVGCIVNHVDTAIRVTKNLRRHNLKVALLVGRLRPADLVKLKTDHPGLLTTHGAPDIDAIVATQTLEVGVDVDFKHLITELAPASSMAQRFGRVNRLGKFDNSAICVIGPVSDSSLKKDMPPYNLLDLQRGFRWIQEFNGQSVNPVALMKNPPPPAQTKRLLFQRLERRDVELLARTSNEEGINPDLDIWLRDSLESEQKTAGIVVRDSLPEDDSSAIQLLQEIPPHADEVFPAPLNLAVDILSKLAVDQDQRFKLELKEPGINRRAFLLRHGELSQLTPTDALQPGDVLIIDRGLVFTTEHVATWDAEDSSAPSEVENPQVRVFVNSKNTTKTDKELFYKAFNWTLTDFTEYWYERHPEDINSSISVSKLPFESTNGEDAEAAWFVIKRPAEVKHDEDAIQEYSDATPALLSDHQNNVANRGGEIARALGISPQIEEWVIQTGIYHDLGKSDPRFQICLGNEDLSVLKAKSFHQSQQERSAAKASSGLPSGWRHEQLSAALLMDKRRAQEIEVDEEVIYLVGVSHGYGRNYFVHSGEQLSDMSPSGHDLFTTGEWDSLVHRVVRNNGAYSILVPEFIERAADAQISKEGN